MISLPPIKDVRIKNVSEQLMKIYNWTSFCIGKNKVRTTPSGGVHYTGKEIILEACSFEITYKRTYYMISLFEYPKGIMVHIHVDVNQLDKASDGDVLEIYNNLVNHIENITKNSKGV